MASKDEEEDINEFISIITSNITDQSVRVEFVVHFDKITPGNILFSLDMLRISQIGARRKN